MHQFDTQRSRFGRVRLRYYLLQLHTLKEMDAMEFLRLFFVSTYTLVQMIDAVVYSILRAKILGRL